MNKIRKCLYIRDTHPTSSSIRISACRGRNLLSSMKMSGDKQRLVQVIEIGGNLVTNTITSVDKNNWLWIEREL